MWSLSAVHLSQFVLSAVPYSPKVPHHLSSADLPLAQSHLSWDPASEPNHSSVTCYFLSLPTPVLPQDLSFPVSHQQDGSLFMALE